MKDKRSRFKVFAVIMMLILQTLSLNSFAADADEAVFFSGFATSESGYWSVDAEGNVAQGTEENYNVAYNASTDTLTLKNAVIDSSDFESLNGVDYNINCGIAVLGDINIILIGENEILADSGIYFEGTSYGIINLSGDTFISGNGELTVTLGQGGDRYALYSAEKFISIKDATFNVNTVETRHNLSAAVCAPKIEVKNAAVNFDFNNQRRAYGFYAVPEYCYAKIIDSDVDITLYDCHDSAGFNIYETNISNSDVDIFSELCNNPGYGIFSYKFICENSYVDVKVDYSMTYRKVSAIAYNNALINNDPTQQIDTLVTSVKITPEETWCSAIYVSPDRSIYNPLEGIYGGYRKCVNGVTETGTYDDWNLYFDGINNTLYMKDAHLGQTLRILGSADIVLEGESTIICDDSAAIISNLSQNFSGSGSLTLISQTAAYQCYKKLEFGDGVIVTASTSADGSNPVEFKSEDSATYKWIKIQGTDEPEPEEPEIPEEPAELTFWQKLVAFFEGIWEKIDDFFEGIYQSIKQQ